MTNIEIILENAIANNIFTEEQITTFLKETGDLPLHTFNEWRKMGYIVKKGEKAAMTCDIWRMTNYKKDESKEEQEEKENHFYMKKAFFFTFEQVEKINNKASA